MCTDLLRLLCGNELHLLKVREETNASHHKTMGVIMEATPQPNLWNVIQPNSIIMKVASPVAVEKSPMKDECSFGLGNCALSFDFHVTYTKLIIMPYATTKVARPLTYFEEIRTFILSFMLSLGLFC